MLSQAQRRLLTLRVAALWTFAGLALLTCALWAASLWGIAWANPRGNGNVQLWFGLLQADNRPVMSQPGLSAARAYPGSLRWWTPSWDRLLTIHNWGYGYHRWSACIPFWLLLTPCLLAFAAAWLSGRRTLDRLHNRLCMKCGYSLASLPRADICPECGHPREFKYPK